MLIIHRAYTGLTVTAGAYTAGDVVGGVISIAPLTFASGGYLLRAVTLVDEADVKAALKLWLFNSQPSSIADNAPLALTASDHKALVGVMQIATADYYSSGGIATAHTVPSQPIAFAGDRLYGYLVCDGTPTYSATTDLSQIRLTLQVG